LVGADVRIEGTEIEHSIVMDDAQLLFVGSRLETSIIGRGASCGVSECRASSGCRSAKVRQVALS
jgi:NDP-sugar pyrophosphorylase family protein